MKKKTFVINGRSGVGKDSLIAFAGQKYSVRNFSSVDRVKEAAMLLGWDGVKDDQGRQFLVEIKDASVKYNDLPLQWIVEQHEDFEKSGDDMLFVHIREPKEIQKMKTKIPQTKTILVTRQMETVTDSKKDDLVTDYDYDYTFANDKPLDESGKDFVELIERA